MPTVPDGVTALATALSETRWVRDVMVAGSLATGDYVPGVSDLDLVAIVDGRVDEARVRRLTLIHEELDRGPAAGADLGCVYVEERRRADHTARHPTWTHGELVDRILSGITRAELVRHGFAVHGRTPSEVFPAVSDDDVRAAAHAELTGYWAWAARRPRMWLNPVMVDLGLTSMARGRHACRTGRLLTKTRALDEAHAPDWLVDQLRARRRGEAVTSPRLRSGWIAWRDAWTTTRAAQGPGS